MIDFLPPIVPHISSQVSLLYMLLRGTSPLKGSLRITAFMFVIFGHLNMSIDMTIGRGCFPQTDRLPKITTSLLQRG